MQLTEMPYLAGELLFTSCKFADFISDSSGKSVSENKH
jgi:hypothetical protein